MSQLFELARQARAPHPHPTIGVRHDGALILATGSAPASCPVELESMALEPRVVHYHPSRGWTAEQAQADIAALRAAHPLCRVHGLSPGFGYRTPVDSFCLYTGDVQTPATGAAAEWQQCLKLDVACQASFVYGPGTSLDDVRHRLEALRGCARLESILPLPAAVGDRVMVPGATTAGVLDMEVLALTAATFPNVPVRASWAALGWKVAQASVVFGARQLAGWGLEELIAYGSRTRPASVVGEAEALAGVAEARLGAEACS